MAKVAARDNPEIGCPNLPAPAVGRSPALMSLIDSNWLTRPAPEVAPDLLGCGLVRQLPDGTLIRGTIVETEAYEAGDPACHAYRRETPRNRVMFGPAGLTYVYLIYGVYCCLNVVTDREGFASAVLIRALALASVPPHYPRPQENLQRIAAGPGKLCRVLQIDRTHTAQPLQPGSPLWLEHRHPDWQQQVDRGTIAFRQTTRIGLTQGADIPWRWYVKDCQAVSQGKVLHFDN
jgi:DNA-3-methyladenine glycosylase